jgi:predicted ester cyclase
MQFTIEDVITEGDEVVVRWTVRGTHQGEFMGIPPTNNRVTLTGMSIERVSGDKIVETWDSYDAMGLMQQLGVIPEPGQAGS